MEDRIVVSICCLVYNHEKYIAECLDSFLMQKTNFVYEILIHDDASTDETAKIVREYEKKFPDIIKPIYQTKNQYSNGVRPSVSFQFPRARGEYIAICEGDDYWTDPLKLQKQVNFLERNGDYGLVSTQRQNFYQKEGKLSVPVSEFTKPFETYLFKDILIESKIATLTVLCRSNLMKEYIELYNSNKSKMGGFDYGIWLYFSYKMKIAILKDITAVYRVLPESASHSSDISKRWALRKKYYKDFKFYISFLPDIPPSLINKAEYFRAKGYYILAGKSNDIDTCKELLKIFKNNNDRIRYIMLKIFMKTPKLFNIALVYEKINRRLISKKVKYF